jgi:hypothetical protein
MLFDIRGRRKRVIQVVYALLAGLFLIGFVGFGIGNGGGSGGILDAIGLGGGDSGTGSAQFDTQISNAKAKAKKDPKDPKPQLELAKVYFLAGNSAVEQDPQTGQATVTADAATEFQSSVDAWERYLKLNGNKQPDAGAAAQIFRAYQGLAQQEIASSSPDTAALQADLKGAATTATLQAQNVPSANTWFAAAQFDYLSGDTAAGDSAGAKALAKVNKTQRKQLEKQLQQIKKEAAQLQKQIKSSGPGKGALTSPLGGVGGTTGGTSGGAAPPPGGTPTP